MVYVVEGDLTRLDRLLEQLLDIVVDTQVHSFHNLIQFLRWKPLCEFRVKLYLRDHIGGLLTGLSLLLSLNEHIMKIVPILHLVYL